MCLAAALTAAPVEAHADDSAARAAARQLPQLQGLVVSHRGRIVLEYSSTGTSHLLSAILTKATGRSTHQFAVEALARPMGITLARWPRDPQGIYFGGNDMLTTPRQMIAVGELWLNDGRAKGAQAVPAAWAEASCQPRTRSRWDPEREYGYGWWSQTLGGSRACFAWGFGGQHILVFTELELVIAVTSATAVSDERHAYRQQLFALLEAHVLPLAIRQGVLDVRPIVGYISSP